MKRAPADVLRAIARRSVEAVAFLTPLFVLPWTVSPLEINKQGVFYLLATIGILAWLGYVLLTRTLHGSLQKLWLPFLVFFGCVAVSTVLSVDPYTSIFGQLNQEYTSLVTIALGMILAFVASQILDVSSIRAVMKFALLSAALVAGVALVAFFGLTFDTFPTNLLGTPNALAVYLIVMSCVGSALLMTGTLETEREKYTIGIATTMTVFGTLAVLFAIDYGMLWGIALFGSAVIFGLGLLHPVVLTKPIRFTLPMLLFVNALFFLVLPTMVANPFPSEVALNSRGSWGIATATLTEESWLFGSGPGTYVGDFDRYHSADLNTTSFWDTRFDRGSSALLTMVPTMGVLATLAWVLGVLAVGVCAVLAFRRAQHPHDLPAIVGWIVLAFAWFVYPQNMTLTVLFWVFLGVVVHNIPGRHITISFDRSPRTGFFTALCAVIISVFIFTVTFATVSKYRADIAFARAAALSIGGGSLDDIILALDRAATLNRWSDVYYRNLGSALLKKVIVLARDTGSDPQLVKSLIGAAINATIRATELGPKNVVNWELRGDVYREVSPLVADAATFAIAAYQEAEVLSPQNPRHAVDVARGHLAYVDVLMPIAQGDDDALAEQAKTAQERALQSASDALMRAIQLKSDYAEARYYFASVQERQGKLAEAVASMELVRASVPSDVGVGLQLALLYLRQGKHIVAKQELERIIAIAPNFSNAHWYLAAVLEEEDDIEGALIELETIMTIDPENVTVQKKIDALRAGQVATTTLPDPLPSVETPVLPDVPTTP